MLDLAQAIELHQLTIEVGNRAKPTQYWYRLVLGRFLDYLQEQLPTGTTPTLANLTLDLARSFVVHVRDGTSTNPVNGATRTRGPRTLYQHIRALKAFSHWAVDEGLLAHDPLRNLKSPKVPTKILVTFTPEHIAAMVRVIEGQLQRARNLAILCLLLDTGMRASELCGLTLDNLDLKARRARIHGKGDKWRMAYFGAATAKALMLYLAERKPDSKRPEVFLTYRGDMPLRGASLYRLVQDWGIQAGIDKQVRCSPHTFRHSMASNFLTVHPGALFHLQELLGHSDLAMVKRYARLAESEVQLEGPSPVEKMGLDKYVKPTRRRP